ncbi:DUF4352 domain-containing protein [Geobacillus kaustophilus]|uniref:DUF4352 domain-containing protein n=1 Tax=Geobacillus kaustophilus TaxID=1462 RepID=UPI0005CDAAED|nr:DUF4352 domain-containing protein [Geobacillus kaustophilus]
MSEKKKKPFYKRWWVWLLAVIIVGAIASGGGEDSAEPASTEPKKEETKTDAGKKETTKKEEPKQEEKKLVGIGQPLKVGDVVFTVHGTSTANNVGGEFGQKAQGTYLIVDVAVKNEGKKAITTDSSFFKLKVGDTEYEADATADPFVNQNGSGFFLQQVNPGIENKGKIVFDVPADVANSKDLILNVQTGFFGTEQGQIKLSK